MNDTNVDDKVYQLLSDIRKAYTTEVGVFARELNAKFVSIFESYGIDSDSGLNLQKLGLMPEDRRRMLIAGTQLIARLMLGLGSAGPRAIGKWQSELFGDKKNEEGPC